MKAPRTRSKFGLLLGLVSLGTSACYLSFPDYPPGDLCAASKDLSITEKDPALRGCKLKPATEADPEGGAPPAAAQDDASTELGLGGSK